MVVAELRSLAFGKVDEDEELVAGLVGIKCYFALSYYLRCVPEAG